MAQALPTEGWITADGRKIGPVLMEMKNITLRFGGVKAITDISFDIREGEIRAIIGPNGAGKSTLLSLLSGERQPSSGRVLLGGRPISEYEALELARTRAVLTQDNSVSFPFLVGQVVEMGRSPWARTSNREQDTAVIADALERTDVSHLLGRRFTQLSGGERARVSLARVLAQDTSLVLLDEPTAALDLRHQEDVLRIARDLASYGRTVIVVLHDLSLAGAYADRVALLERGRLRAVGTPAEVLTEELVSEVYQVAVEVILRDGRPLVIPRR